MLTYATAITDTKYAGNFEFHFKILSADYSDNFLNMLFLCKVLIFTIDAREHNMPQKSRCHGYRINLPLADQFLNPDYFICIAIDSLHVPLKFSFWI